MLAFRPLLALAVVAASGCLGEIDERDSGKPTATSRDATTSGTAEGAASSPPDATTKRTPDGSFPTLLDDAAVHGLDGPGTAPANAPTTFS